MTQRSLSGVAIFGIGGIVCLLAGAQTIGQATTDTNDMFVGMAFMAIGAFGLLRALLMGIRS